MNPTPGAPINLTELRLDLLEAYRDVKSDSLNIQKAKELSNLAGKIIKSVAVQIEYANIRKETPDIPFAK